MKHYRRAIHWAFSDPTCNHIALTDTPGMHLPSAPQQVHRHHRELSVERDKLVVNLLLFLQLYFFELPASGTRSFSK